MREKIARLKSQLDFVFENYSYREAHARSKEILTPLAGDKDFFAEIVLECVARKEYLQSGRINPVLAFNLLTTPAYSLIVHVWIPRPDHRTDISHQSIHHHGKLLLSSLAAFGEGYESLLFAKGYKLYENRSVEIQPQKFYKNPQGNFEFVDSFTPHIVFYPEKLSVTYALWSNEEKNKTDTLKKNPFLQQIKKPLKKLIETLGLNQSLGLNTVENFDFSLEENRCFALPKRIQYEAGSVENFLEAFGFVMQEMGFPKKKELLAVLAGLPQNHSLQKFIDKLNQGIPFENRFEENHLQIPHVNISRQEILRHFPLQ